MRIHGWVTHPETDEQGYFRRSDDCVVRLQLSDIVTVELTSSDLPAIIFSLEMEAVADGWSITWDSSYGCEGRVVAGALRLVVEPGLPD